ncbi:hydrolase [Amniculicola lignicola CBS 123094]|uniref:Hydrolase n=1 Tax=Amniculicola lignicola CBS 123094 TaxID=1392246 RepID=A0A6A5WNP1_9PLEO|nr:hydrolase [Amniculicola lignicola CBS 123094]
MTKTTIINVRVFDGEKVAGELSTVSIDENGRITGDNAVNLVDGAGMTLLPGLWDSHVHLSAPGPDTTEKSVLLLENMIKRGITTTIDCGAMSQEQYKYIRAHDDLPDIRYVRNFATSSGSTHSKFAMINKDCIVDTVEAATAFVERCAEQNADFIKIVADVPGPSQEIINQLSKEAKERGLKTIVHAARKAAFQMALQAEPKVNIITHVPMDDPLTVEMAAKMKEADITAVPTLVMSESLCNAKFFPGLKMSAAIESVKRLHQAGVTILVGTDSNQSPIGPKHGEAIYREMELLEEAGMSPVEILRAATHLSAERFNMLDRGSIGLGKRADLVLVDGDPTRDMQLLRNIRKVWNAGKEVHTVGGTA